MSVVIEGLLQSWNKNLDYGQRLIADLSQDQMALQPAPEGSAPSNHPAWVYSHLNVYLPVLEGLIDGVEFADPKEHPFGMLSKPESDASIYPSKDELLQAFVTGHESVAKKLAACDDSVLANPVMLERWKQVMPNLACALPYVMLCHENQHFGQVSAWRRIQGLPSV